MFTTSMLLLAIHIGDKDRREFSGLGHGFAPSPLCQRPNACVSNHRAILARWYNTNPPCLTYKYIFRLARVAVKVDRTAAFYPEAGIARYKKVNT
jgi:hypothetical protein